MSGQDLPLYSLDTPTLQYAAREIVRQDRVISRIKSAIGIENEQSLWVTKMLPRIQQIIQRRENPYVYGKLKKPEIVATLQRYLAMRKRGPRYWALCPFHNDHDASLTIDAQRQRWKCWSCGLQGDVIDFVRRWKRNDTR